MIHYDKVTKIYPDKTIALKGVTFSIKPKEFVTVIGHSGAGKSTLLKMLIAEEKPTEGAVFFESANIHKLPKKEISKVRRRVGVVFQDFRLISDKTAYENIAFAMEAAGRNDTEIIADVPYILELVGLGHKMTAFPRELSGGEKQRVAIARAIVNQPDIIIADEPTGNLDPENTYDIVNLLQKINELGTTVLLTTHNKGVVDALRGRIIVMQNGEIVDDNSDGVYKF